MKGLNEIPECCELFEQMFAEWDKIPQRQGGKDLLHEKRRKEIEKEYWPKLIEAYEKYKQEHPEEFKGE